MKEAIELLRENGLLRVIEEEVDIDLEMAHIAYVEVKKDDSKALLFTKPISKRLDKKFDIPVLMNVFGSFRATNLFFEKDPNEVAAQIQELLHLKPPSGFMDKIDTLSKLFNLRYVSPKRLSQKGLCQQVIKQKDELSLFDLPVLKTWEEDGGAFITMGQVYTQSLDGKRQNLGMYRLQVYDKNRLGMHWQIHKDSAHFFHEYKQANQKMPVSVAIGGDPLYIWCGQAPLPHGIFELLLYGFVKEKNPRLVKSLTNPIYIPEDVDFVLEGWVDPSKMEIEGPFGDHTGYYTLMEPYPVMDVECITSKKEPTFLATVVGKPPLEDKYMGWATERIFLPLLKTTVPDLIDYKMPENGVFHNLILAKIKNMYPHHAKQAMHAFWGVGQMSFVKHAIFVGSDAPDLDNYEELSDYILDRVCIKNIIISEGVADALDHSSPSECYGGKLGVDCTNDNTDFPHKSIISDEELFVKIEDEQIKEIKQYKTHTKSPILVCGVDKKESLKHTHQKLSLLKEHTKIVVYVDSASNALDNPYMLIWRVVNNIDAKRDIFIDEDFIGIDATNKNELDNYTREWPGDANCTKSVIDDLLARGLLDIDEKFIKRFQLY